MLIRLLENFLISKYNQRRDEWLANAAPPAAPAVEVPPDYTILGHVLPWPDEEINDPIVTQLHDQGIVALPPESRRRHVYILGATGTGKTNLLLRLIESDIKSKRAFCVIDLRGDLVDRILLRLADTAAPPAWSKRLLLMDLRDTQRAVGFNPLAGDGDIHSRVLHLMSVLKQQSESWGVQFPETMRNSLFALAQTGWTLLEIEPLLTNPVFRSQVVAQVRDRQVRGFFRRFEEMSKHNQVSYVQPVLNKITPLLAIPAVRYLLGQKQTVSFRPLIDQQPGMVVLVALGVDRLHDAAQLVGGLILSSFQTAIMARSDQPESQRVPVHLYVDEFESLASERFLQIVAEGRRFGLGLTLSHQNNNQLAPDMRQALRNNIHTQAYFQTGAQDAAELAKEIGGKNREVVRQCLMSQQTGQAFLVRRGQTSTHVQVQMCPDPVVSPADVQALRQASAQTYTRPVAEIEQELEQRDQQLNLVSTSGSSTSHSPQSKDKSTPPPTYEIRHSKTTTFGPKRNGPARKTPADAPTSSAPDDSDPSAEKSGNSTKKKKRDNKTG